MADGTVNNTVIENARNRADFLSHTLANADSYIAAAVRSALASDTYLAARHAFLCLLDYSREMGLESMETGYSWVHEIFGNPFRPIDFAPWRTGTAVTLARQMYESREFSAMPILADALQDAGCTNEDVLNHCRDANQVHVRGCWVVDGVLGKE